MSPLIDDVPFFLPAMLRTITITITITVTIAIAVAIAVFLAFHLNAIEYDGEIFELILPIEFLKFRKITAV